PLAPPTALKNSLFQLAQRPLVALERCKPLNQAFNWQVAQIHALFNAIYQQGISTEQDEAKLDKINEELKSLSQRLKEEPLTQAQKTQAMEALKQARGAVRETRGLITHLRRYVELVKPLDEQVGLWVDRCFAPQHRGEVLLALPEMQTSFRAFEALKREVF